MPRKRRSRSLVVYLTASVAACGGSNPDSGRLPDITNAGQLRDTATVVAQWTARLDQLDGVPRLGGIAVGADGFTYVAGSDGRISRVSPDGVVAPFRGPRPDGEALVTALALEEDGHVWLREAVHGTMQQVAPDGSTVKEIPVEPGMLLWGSKALSIDESGRVWVGIHPSESRSDARTSGARPAYAQLTDSGLADTVFVTLRTTMGCTEPDPHYRFGWFEDFRVRYVPFTTWSLTPSGALVAGCPAEYSFEIGGSNGRLVRVAPWTPVAVSEKERSDFVATWSALMSNRPGVPLGSWSWTGPELPPRKPAYGAILTSSDSRIWIWTSQPSTTEPSNPTWPLAGLPEVLWIESGLGTFDVYEPDGRLRGHVRLPSEVRFTPTPETPEPAIRGDTIWAETKTADGTPALTRYTVAWP